MANLGFKLTQKEKAAIAALEKLAVEWPDSLWIFAADGVLNVMIKAGGKKVIEPLSMGGSKGIGGGFDPDFIVGTVDIESDGGSW